MRNAITLISFLWLSLSSISDLSAQQFGVRAGYQLAGTYNDGAQVGGNINYFYAGLFKNNPLFGTNFLQIHTGLDYFQNGWRTDDSNFRRLHTVGTTIGIRGNLGPLYAQLGPNLNFVVSEQYEVNGQDALTEETETDWFDLAGHVGVGLNILIVSIEVRYHYGFLDVYQGNHNSYWQFGAAVHF